MGEFDSIVFWHWWALAAVLVLLEFTRPGFVLLWLGFAAAAIGFLLVLFPSIPVYAQLIIFGLLCIVALLSWRYFHAAGKGNPLR